MFDSCLRGLHLHTAVLSKTPCVTSLCLRSPSTPVVLTVSNTGAGVIKKQNSIHLLILSLPQRMHAVNAKTEHRKSMLFSVFKKLGDKC